MKKDIIFSVIFATVISPSVAQKDLKSVKHGLHLMYGIVSKDELIDDVRFADGKDETVTIIRFDNNGHAQSGEELPFTISSKEPIRVDSLGLTSLRMNPDTLEHLLDLVSKCENKEYKFPGQRSTLIRVTFRRHGISEQFYIADEIVATRLFKKIERLFLRLNDKTALRKLYFFLGPSNLLRYTRNGPEWVHKT